MDWHNDPRHNRADECVNCPPCCSRGYASPTPTDASQVIESDVIVGFGVVQAAWFSRPLNKAMFMFVDGTTYSCVGTMRLAVMANVRATVPVAWSDKDVLMG